MAQIFSPPKKIEATMPSGRKTYRYAGDSDTLKKKIAGLKKSGASGVSVVAEEITFKKGSPGEHLNKEKPLTPSKEKHYWADKGVYPKKADGSPLLTHRFFKQVSDPSKDDTKLIKKVAQKRMEKTQQTEASLSPASYVTGNIPKPTERLKSGMKVNRKRFTSIKNYKPEFNKKVDYDALKVKNEESNLQELSPETVVSFMKKRQARSNEHGKLKLDATSKKEYKYHDGQQRKNFKGVMKAISHAGNTLKRRARKAGLKEIAQQSIITHNIKSKDSNRPVVKKGAQLEGYFNKLDVERQENERLGRNKEQKKEKKKSSNYENRVSKAWQDIGYTTKKEGVEDYIEVKGGNMSKKEISKLVKNRKKEMEEGKKPGLWDNIHAKRARIKAGSGERMRKPGSKGAPTAQDFKDASESNVAFKNFLEARQIDERKGGATAGFLMRQLYLKRLMKRLNLPVSVAAMIDK